MTLQKAETAYLRDDYVRASGIAKSLLERDLPLLNRVKVLELQILLQTSRLNYRRALEIGQRALALLGEHLPLSPKAPRLLTALMSTRLLLRGHDDKSLLRLPDMTDPEKLATIRILGLLSAPAYFTELYLLPLIGLRIVNHTIRHGNAPHSPYGYVIYGMLHCAVLGDPVKGRAYGELARASVSRLGASETDCRVCMVHGGFIQHWTAPLADSLPVFEEGWEKAVAAGDLEYHGYARYGYASYALMAGMPLNRVADVLDRHLEAVTEHPHEKTQRIMIMARASVARMRGRAPDPDLTFDAEASQALWADQRDATSLAYFHKYAMLEALMSGDYEEVLRQADAITQNLNGILSMAYEGFYQFYEGLAALELARTAPTAERLALRRKARKLTRRLNAWARHAPRTFAQRARLLEAELAATKGSSDAAIRAFEEAIVAARESGALHDLGLFHERAAGFYAARGATSAASAFLTEAQSAYMAWGGLGWAEALQQKFPDAAPLRPLISRAPTGEISHESSSSSGSQIVDSATLISAAAALANKTSLREVVSEVVRAIVVNAGADRGVLLLADGDDLRTVADAQGANVALLDPDAGASFDGFARSIVNYVHRSESQLVLDDAVMDPSFGTDPHVQETRPSSVLCVPLMAKGDVTGIVYLENTRVRGMFTPDRCRTVSVLGAQAAVSVQNARLFDDLRTALDRQVELTDAHARFVPHSFLQTLNRPSIDQIRLGDHVQAEASILFSDIRGFTALVETMEPKEAIEFINAYLSRMEPAVQEGGGFVDSYVGDAVMAVFDRGPEAAITAGLAMIRGLRAWTRANQGEAPIRIGIGIASGEIMFGTIGAANRIKCGVIGSTVNLASRIEGLTKRYGLGLLISQGAFRTLPDPNRFLIRDVDLVTVVGRQAPVRLMEVFDADPRPLREQKARTQKDVYWGLRLYRNGAVDQALEIFEQCRVIAPDDPLIPILLERARRAAERGSDPEWDGIEHIDQK